MERELKRVKTGKLLLIPASEDTRGHGTTYAKQLGEWLASVPQKGM
jgi:homoserine O-acetyltransferase